MTFGNFKKNLVNARIVFELAWKERLNRYSFLLAFSFAIVGQFLGTITGSTLVKWLL